MGIQAQEVTSETFLTKGISKGTDPTLTEEGSEDMVTTIWVVVDTDSHIQVMVETPTADHLSGNPTHTVGVRFNLQEVEDLVDSGVETLTVDTEIKVIHQTISGTAVNRDCLDPYSGEDTLTVLTGITNEVGLEDCPFRYRSPFRSLWECLEVAVTTTV